MTDEPRYKPSYADDQSYEDKFLMQHGDIDIWLDVRDKVLVVVKGEASERRQCNFDVYNVQDGQLRLFGDEKQDVHLTLADMTVLYSLAIEHGLMEEPT